MIQLRKAEITRETKETKIILSLNIDGEGKSEIETPITFLNHLLKTFSTHSLIDLKISAEGDLSHHIIEDIAICLGKAIDLALKDRDNLIRFGYAIVPMDDSLAIAAIDLVKRPYAKIDLNIFNENVEGVNCEDIKHFLETLAFSIPATIHINVKYGINNHHKIEASFKALALSIRKAIERDYKRKEIPSTKGTM
ncbi:MAG: imidazoleglycerol-phosphate dehydratase HisB [Nitrososphaerota archaeon]